MSTLYIDRKNTRMTVSGNTLVFYENGERASTLPLHLIDRICIKGDLTLSAADLGKLGAHDIGVLILSGRSQQPAICLPCARKDALRRLAQAHLSQDNPFCIQQAQTWITEKIQREQELLRDLQTRPHHGGHQIHESLVQLEQRRCQLKKTVSDLATLRGIEGSAAAATFAAIASVLPESLHFSGRNRNPPRDPYNVGLSLGYTLLHYAMVRHIHLTGLDPCIGYYHSITHNRESLACDLIEAMRPLVTSWTIDAFREHTLRPEDFTMQGDACHMGKAARARYYPAFENALKTWQGGMRERCVALLRALGNACFNHPQTRNCAAAFLEEEALLTL